jgi:uncharacterized protein involved in type VI secretion and phage assembly
MTDAAVAVVGRLPTIVVDVDGQPLQARQTAGLVEVIVRQALAAPALCELIFAEPPGTLEVAEVLKPGAELRVSQVGSDVALFEGDVTAVEHAYGAAHSRELRVRGYDKLHRLRKRQNVRVLLDKTPQQVAEEVAGAIGASVEATDSGPTWQRLAQHRQTDLKLLLEVTSRSGLYPVLLDGTLHLITLDGFGEPVSLHWGTTLLEARIEANGEPATSSVEATGWDPSRSETWTAMATTPRVGRSISAAVSAEDVGGSGVRVLVDEPVPDQERATALAQAELDARVADEVTFWGVAAGDPRLRPGAPIDIDNVGPDLSGRYVVTEAIHRISRVEGYLTEISTAPPPIPERERATVAVPGVVKSVDDPDQLGRVQVTLPTIGDIESAWMEVLSVGAGSGKGLVALPDVDDSVLVLLLHGDPAQGIVLGGLYGTGGPVDSGVVGGQVQRYTFLTRGNQRIKLDDEAKELVLEDSSSGKVTMGNQKIRIEDVTGSSIEMTQQNVVLHSAVSLRIEAPGNSIVIKASSIDFESA